MRALRLLLVLALPAVSHSFAQTTLPDVTGRWAGTLDIVHADGSVDAGDAFLQLTQHGTVLTGSAGANAHNLTTMSSGSVSSNALDFALTLNQQTTVRFHLVRSEQLLTGDAQGLPGTAGDKVVVRVARADEAWHTISPMAHVTDHLRDTIAALDKRLFAAYNNCDLTALGTLVTDDLEFYHDKTGLAVGKQVFIESIRNNICGKTHRTLDENSLEAHRLNRYGAVEIGTHRFTHPGHPDDGTGEAKFVMLWRLKDGDWKLTRVISYDHEPMKQ